MSHQLFWDDLPQRCFYQCHFTGAERGLGISTTKSLQSFLRGSRGPSDKTCPFPSRNKEKRPSNCGYKGFFPVQQQALQGILGRRRWYSLTHTDPSIWSLLLHAHQDVCCCSTATPRVFPFSLRYSSCCLSSPPQDCQTFGSSAPPRSMISCKGASALAEVMVPSP